MIDKNLSIPLYLQIQNYLIDQIRRGEYPAGSQVPSELEISAQMNVSRMTARKALDTLVSKGILYRRKGKGTYVADDTVSYNLTTMQSFSHILKARGYEVSTRVLRIDVAPGEPDILEHLQLPVDTTLIVIRRLRLIDGKPAAIHTAYLEHRIYAPILEVDLSTESLLDAMHAITGVQLVYSQDSVQADLVKPEEKRLLDLPPGSPVLRVEGVTYSEYGEPTRLSRAVFRGDLFKLMVKNTTSLAASLNITETTGSG